MPVQQNSIRNWIRRTCNLIGFSPIRIGIRVPDSRPDYWHILVVCTPNDYAYIMGQAVRARQGIGSILNRIGIQNNMRIEIRFKPR